MLLTSKFLDSIVAVIPSNTLVKFIIRQQGHQLRKHRFSLVHNLVYEQFLGNSNRKNLFSLSKPVFIGHYEDWKKVNGTLLISIDINLHLQKMKKIYLLLICFLLFTNRGFGQTNFESESDVLTYLDGKTFYSTDQSVKVKIGYSSTLGTYGFILNGTASHFNLTIVILSPTRAVITGESLSDPDGKMKIRINSTTDCVENEGSYYCVKK